MNTLTEKERNGLEEVFNAIHSDKTKYSISAFLASFLLIDKSDLKAKITTSSLKGTLKLDKLSLFLANYSKKKKNLSK
jgi:hypothetical protein